jgi:hypothetical protein
MDGVKPRSAVDRLRRRLIGASALSFAFAEAVIDLTTA